MAGSTTLDRLGSFSERILSVSTGLAAQLATTRRNANGGMTAFKDARGQGRSNKTGFSLT